jgi:hypothetical protein
MMTIEAGNIVNNLNQVAENKNPKNKIGNPRAIVSFSQLKNAGFI